ncbi:MAG: acyltransferase [Akkermansiaceae bacterium]|nr:acyltransferase [Akkermansiaceae bacterium]
MSGPHPSRLNNFDLIRLLAAAQVVFVHAVGHTPLLHEGPEWLRSILEGVILFPGVAVFFVVSGFLIAKSYERLRDEPKVYFWHRLLRIYPALFLCFAVTLIALGIFGFLTPDVVGSLKFWGWLGGQLSVGQFYNPEFFRGFGMGVVNGALWTISVELQFYLALPMLYLLAYPRSGRRRFGAWLTVGSFVVSFAAFWYVDAATNHAGGFTAAPMAAKLLYVSLVPHWWMFLMGIWLHRHFATVARWIEGRFVWYFIAYSALAVLRHFAIGRDGQSPALYYLGYLPERALLAFMTLSAAYTARSWSSRLLKGNDISYGIYIYHFLVINVLMECGLMEGSLSVLAVFVASVLLGLASWHFMERRALSLKGLVRSSPAVGLAKG